MTKLEQLNKTVAEKIAAMTDTQVTELYRTARIDVVSRSNDTTDAALVMVAIGNDLERRIGKHAFYRIMGEIDKAATLKN